MSLLIRCSLPLLALQALPAQDLESQLKDLCGADGARRQTAARALPAAGKEALPLLVELLRDERGRFPLSTDEDEGGRYGYNFEGRGGRRRPPSMPHPSEVLPRWDFETGALAPERAVAYPEDLIYPHNPRVLAAYTLGTMGVRAAEAIPALVAGLSAGVSLDEQCAWALARTGPAAVAPLIEVLRSEGEASRLATWALGQLGSSAIGPLLEELGDRDYDTVVQAIYALQLIMPLEKRTVAALVDLLAHSVARVRAHAAQSLRWIGPPALPALRAALEEGGLIQGHLALAVLAMIGAEEGGRALPRALAPELIRVLGEHDMTRRHWSALTLAHVDLDAEQARSVVARLRELQRSFFDRNRLFAYTHLGSFGAASLEALEVLLAGLEESDEDHRRASLIAMAKIEGLPVELAPRLEAIVDEGETGLAYSAKRALARTGSVGLEILLVRGDADGVLFALENLGASHEDEMRALLGREEADLRRAGIEALNSLERWTGPSEAAAINLLEDPELRVLTAHILAERGIDAAAGVLVGELMDGENDGWDRRRAALALGELGRSDERVAAALVEALNSEDAELRAAVARALSELRPATAAIRTALERALLDEGWEVRAAAGAALRAIRGD